MNNITLENTYNKRKLCLLNNITYTRFVPFLIIRI